MASILLVDDDESNRVTLSVLLEEEGYHVDVAASFEDAKRKIVGPERYDVVLLDQHLGDGLGTELVPFTRAKRPKVKVLLISGSIGDFTGLAEIFDGVVPKGAAFPDVLTLVKGALR